MKTIEVTRIVRKRNWYFKKQYETIPCTINIDKIFGVQNTANKHDVCTIIFEDGCYILVAEKYEDLVKKING